MQERRGVSGEISHSPHLAVRTGIGGPIWPAAEVVLAVMAWAAKMERLATAERIAAARERVEAEGGRWGRPQRMARADVFRAQAMRAAGRSIREIAIALKHPRSTVAETLKRASAPSDKPARGVASEPPEDLGAKPGADG
jgi:hypothetical protein